MMIIIIKQLYEIGGNVLSVCVCGVWGGGYIFDILKKSIGIQVEIST